MDTPGLGFDETGLRNCTLHALLHIRTTPDYRTSAGRLGKAAKKCCSAMDSVECYGSSVDVGTKGDTYSTLGAPEALACHRTHH